MATPEEIAEILRKNAYKPPRGPMPKAVRVLLALVLVGGLIYGGWFLVKRYVDFEGFSVGKIVNSAKTGSPGAVAKKVTFEHQATYELYRPDSFAPAKVKRLVLVLAPGNSIGEAWEYMHYWVKIADANGYLIAGIPDWDRAKIIQFLQTIRTAENVQRVYTSGFSNGGYNSCGAGLEFPELVDAIIPMGAFCSLHDVRKPQGMQTPVYAVIGAKDNWALGDDGQLAYASSKGLAIEFLIVPGLGHAFPQSEMAKVATWINAH